MAEVKECKDGYIIAEQRNKFSKGDILDALQPSTEPVVFTAEQLLDKDDNEIESAPHPMMIVKIKSDLVFPKGTLLRKEK
jgi:putative protease